MAGQTWARRALGAGPLVGWDLATLTYLAWTWSTVWPLDAEHTARQTVREDPGRATANALLLTAAVVTLLAIGLVLVRAATSSGPAKDRQAGLSLASVVLSWGVVHTVFTLRYARLYYTGTDGGVDVHQDDPPRDGDFAYPGFTIGMTFQVSDTDLTTTEVRVTALRHARCRIWLAPSSWPPPSTSSPDWPPSH